MKLLYNILKTLAVVIIVLTVALLSAAFFLQDRVAGIVIRSFNEKISTKFEIESVRLSFLRKFPKASLDLKNVLVHSSPGFITECFNGINTDTLLSARSVWVEFRITDIIKGVYNIERIGLKKGLLNILSDTAGKVNYSIAVKNLQSKDLFTLNLDRINLQELDVCYNNCATNLNLRGFVESCRLKSRITGEEIFFNAAGALRIDSFKMYNFTVAKSVSTLIDVTLNSSDSGILFDKSTIRFDGYTFGLSGSVSSENVLDLILSGDNIEISAIRNYLPEDYSRKIAGYNPGGTLKIESKITGFVSGTVNPGIEISCTLENGSVSYLNSALTIKDLSFNCLYKNGQKHSPSSSMLTISNFRGNLGSADYSGSLTLSDFDKPEADFFLRGKIIPAELKEFFDLKEVVWSEGNIDVDLKLHGFIPKKKKYSIRDVLSLNPVADLRFNSFGIGMKKSNLFIKKVNGELLMDSIITVKNLKFSYRDHSFFLNGRFINLPWWLLGDPVVLTGTADASCNKLIPEILFNSSSAGDSAAKEKSTIQFPGDIIFDLNIKTDTLLYKDFRAANVNCIMSYKPRILNFKTLTLNTLDGFISGNGFIVQNTNKSIISRCTFILEKINIRNTFSSFNNFGQGFLKAENLDGKLSGSFSLLMPMDSLLKPDIKNLSAEGKYVIADGSLVNFEPVTSLSSFIELSELENIRFEELENDFFIKNNVLYIPQMDIRSSAADLSVNGKHGFDNNYEYHLKILLSELLSKKLKKPRPNTTEFGAVRDDGLGRTTLLLKIENKGDDVVVGYDVKAASDGIKSNIKAERKNLKTILNEEYGWFKNDSTIEQKPAAGSPRFKISWEETDTLKEESAPPAVKKESVIKKIFRKK